MPQQEHIHDAISPTPVDLEWIMKPMMCLRVACVMLVAASLAGCIVVPERGHRPLFFYR